jgi:hypothetical protein
VSETRGDTSIGFAVLIVGGLLVYGALSFYNSLESNGWIKHGEDALITVDSNWLPNETKECISVPISQWYQTQKQEEWLGSFESLLGEDTLLGDDRRARIKAMTPSQKQRLYIVVLNQSHLYSNPQNVHPAKSLMKCDSGPEHSIRVSFYGSTDQPKTEAVSWKCMRTDDSFTCNELAVGQTTVTDEDILRAIDENMAQRDQKKQNEDRQFVSNP